MITYPTNPTSYQFAPWTDPSGVQWIARVFPTYVTWSRYTVATGGTSLTNYSQVSGLPGYPISFPPESHGHAWSEITDKPLSFTPNLTGVTPGDIGAATAAQGEKADSAVQPEDLLTSNVAYADTAATAAALANGTISGTTSFTGGAAAQFRTALGAGTAGNAIFVATAYSGVGSVRALLGLDINNNVTHAQITASSYFSGDLVPYGTDQLKLAGSSVLVGSGGIISFRAGAFYAAEDFRLARGGTGILAQSGGANPQKFRVYGTTTGSKYAQLEHDGTNAKLTSSSGDLHISNIPTSNPGPGIIWNDGGGLKIGT